MNKYLLQDAIGMVGDDLIVSATERPILKLKRPNLRAVGLIAACLVFVLCLSVALPTLRGVLLTPEMPNESSNNEAIPPAGTPASVPYSILYSFPQIIKIGDNFNLKLKLGDGVGDSSWLSDATFLSVGSYDKYVYDVFSEDKTNQAFALENSNSSYVLEETPQDVDISEYDGLFPKYAREFSFVPNYEYLSANPNGAIYIVFGMISYASVAEINYSYMIDSGDIIFETNIKLLPTSEYDAGEGYVSAYNDERYYDRKNYYTNTTCSDMGLISSILGDGRTQYAVGETITKYLQIGKNFEEGVEYEMFIESNNISVYSQISQTINIDVEFMEVSFSAESQGDGYLNICIQGYKDGAVVSDIYEEHTFYTYCFNGIVYISVGNSESAKTYANIEIDREIIEFESITSSNISENFDWLDSRAVVDSQVTVCGTILWTDIQGHTHPASNIRVDIHSTFTTQPYEVYTNSNGYYSKTFAVPLASTDSIYIEVFAQGSNVSVYHTSGNYKYSNYSSASNGVVAGQTLTKSMTFGSNDLTSRSISVQQGIAMASNYIKTLINTYMDEIKVIFPTIDFNNDGLEDSSAYCSGNSPYIQIREKDAFDWDVLCHEYGHYVEDVYDISSLVGGIHYLNRNLYDQDEVLPSGYDYSKNHAAQLAWSEGWATFFSIKSQQEMSASTLNIPYVGDSFYSDYENTAINSDLENMDTTLLLGEAGEMAVAGVLYDMSDPRSASDNDDIYMNVSDLWNIVTNPSTQCYTFSEFMQRVRTAGYSTDAILRLGTTLTHFKMAALPGTYRYYNGLPIISWTHNSGSTRYPHNSFIFAFYDTNKNLILRTSILYGGSMSLNHDQWQQILNAEGDEFYYCIETYQSADPTTGPYFSTLRMISKP